MLVFVGDLVVMCEFVFGFIYWLFIGFDLLDVM